MPSVKRVDRRPEDSAAAWFVVLEQARNKGDEVREQQARRELAKLGVTVRYSTDARDEVARDH
jgi:hypothetical protein